MTKTQPARHTAGPLTVLIAEGLDASTNGKGMEERHVKAFQLANAAPALLAALEDAATRLYMAESFVPLVDQQPIRDCRAKIHNAIAQATGKEG